MVRLREIPRTAAFAWSPGSELPLVVTGTRAGAVDAEFSDETKLELWDLSLDNLEQGVELQPVASISTDARFHDIAWAPSNDDHPRGIIAGALENGSLDLWDAQKLIAGANDAFISRTTKHTGAIKSLQFNPLKPQILATAGAKGELYIYDVNDISNPFRLGTAAARSDDLECVAWNRKVAHILATGGSGGFVTVWDLKTKKASLTLNNSRKAVGAIAWDPNNATKLLTATPDDSSPVILLWDLRNSNAPEKTLQGHEQGILSLSWCQQDSDLLLSCGKDNRTLCWNPQTGEQLGEFPEVTNWTFQTRFNPHNPNLSATASFDGKIAIQTLQNTNPSASQITNHGPTDGEDFFTKAQTQPQGASFSLSRAPKWIKRPVGASFGFGGKVVSFGLQPAAAASQSGLSKIRISSFSVDLDFGTAAESFEAALESGDIQRICKSHIANAKSEDEKADWKVIETLIADNPRKRVTEYLGFLETDNVTNGVADLDISVDDKEEKEEGSSEKLIENGVAAAKKQRLSTFFADGVDTDDFLPNLAATKGAKTNNPFKIYSETESSSDRKITKAILLGQFEKALQICLEEDRMADAFMIANCGGKELVDKAQAAYLSQTAGGHSYLRLLASVIGKNLWDIVYNADLGNWKESMATLCTYADPNEFPDLCEALGDRLMQTDSRKDAAFCYLVGSKLEKVLDIWITELNESEQAGLRDQSGDSTFSVHARSLQNFVEKVTVFRDVTNFEDKERNATTGWKLTPLYERYIEYADIVAAHGYLSTADKYLDCLPAHYSAGEVARNRVRQASRRVVPQVQTRQQANSASKTAGSQPLSSFQSIHLPSAAQTTAAVNPYAPASPAALSNPYAPPSATSQYAHQQGYIPPQQQSHQQRYGPAVPAPGSIGYNQSEPQISFGQPLRNTNATSSLTPAALRKDIPTWNDAPMVSKPPISRRGTPGQAPITSPFPNQQIPVMPPSAPPYGSPRSTPAPPKGPPPPRMTSPPSSGPPSTLQQPGRTSSASNMYAPPPPQATQQFGQPPPPATVRRGPSPYNQPTYGPPPTNRYTPAPAAPQFSQPSVPQSQTAPPPDRPPPSSGPYALHQPIHPAQEQNAPQQFQPTAAPPQGPPRGATHGIRSTSRPGSARSQSSKAPAPGAFKYPPGDRSHIPSGTQQMVTIFSNDMQRVAGKAPASFAAQVKDTQKRLNILFDHLNNEELVKPNTVERLSNLAQALQAKDYDTAARMQVDIQRERMDECGTWMVGVKRLISMSKVTP